MINDYYWNKTIQTINVNSVIHVLMENIKLLILRCILVSIEQLSSHNAVEIKINNNIHKIKFNI